MPIYRPALRVVRPKRGPLSGVDFASDEAAELAASEGLTTGRFEGREPTGKGGYTVADVRGIVEGA